MVKKLDVLILGGDSTAHDLAVKLAPSGKKVAVVLPPDENIVPLERLIQILKKGAAAEDESIFPSGIEIIAGSPSFSGPKTVRVGDRILEASKIVIATSGRPYSPPIQGLSEIPLSPILKFLLEEKGPESLIIIGAGPLGVSLAALAAERKISVTLISNKPGVLPDEEPEIAAAVKEHLMGKKVDVLTGAEVLQARKDRSKILLVIEQDGQRKEIEAEEIICATGIVPRVEGLNLQVPGVYVNGTKEISVDEEGRTSCPWIYAVGPATGGKTSLAFMNHMAGITAHNLTAPFFSKMRNESEPIPFTIPFNPPVARVGLTERAARLKYKDVRVSVTSTKEGLIKLVGQKKGAQLLGAHIFSPHSEEAVLYFNLAMRAGIPLSDLLDEQHHPPYTMGDDIYQSIKSWVGGI